MNNPEYTAVAVLGESEMQFFSPESVELDEDNVPQNLMPGTRYALLTESEMQSIDAYEHNTDDPEGFVIKFADSDIAKRSLIK